MSKMSELDIRRRNELAELVHALHVMSAIHFVHCHRSRYLSDETKMRLAQAAVQMPQQPKTSEDEYVNSVLDTLEKYQAELAAYDAAKAKPPTEKERP